jgi:trk system potassium uptake protein TrkA
MKAIIVGCGRIGSQLAYSMYKRGHEISVVDEEEASFENLPTDFQGRLHEGDAMNQDVLERAGVKNCDALAAVTDSDALNIIIAHIAQSEYKVERVIARNYDPKLRKVYEVFGIQVVSSTSWGSQRIEELMTDTDIRTVFSAGNGEVEIYELPINAPLNNLKISDLITCNTCTPLAITRAGKASLPDMDTVVQSGDILTVAATMDGIQSTHANLLKLEKEG